MQESGVYRITNIRTGRAYVGSSVNVSKRLAWHFNELERGVHHCGHLQNSYNKWGKDAFDCDIIEYIDDVTKLIEREQFYIDSLGFKNLYNSSPTAGSSLGVKRSEETKAKLRTRIISPETRAKISAAATGRKDTEETNLKRRLRKATEETKAKLRAYKATDETKAKLSAARKGYKHTPETKAKNGASWVSRIVTEETRVKQREAWIARAARGITEETREKQRLSAKKEDAQCKAVQQLNPITGEVIATFYSAGEAYRQTLTCQSSISKVCAGKAKIAGGYGWRFL